MQFLKNVKIDFLAKQKTAFYFSSGLILVGLISLALHGGPNYGIDFLGGTSMALSFEKPVQIGQVRDAISAAGFEGAEIKHFGGENEILIRIEQQDVDSEISDPVKSSISTAISGNPFQLLSEDTVGPKIGAELRGKMIWAILAAMFFILLYISWRFEFGFAVGAIVALFHDITITLGIFSILRLELTLAIIAAFLTIVGYSLNDTIVVFDRIRENLKTLRREKYEAIVNTSINQSLSRTIVTSLTTLMVVIILFIFGGEVIHDFAFALITGVLIGTYSSIFIASPIVVVWENRRSAKKGKPVVKRA